MTLEFILWRIINNYQNIFPHNIYTYIFQYISKIMNGGIIQLASFGSQDMLIDHRYNVNFYDKIRCEQLLKLIKNNNNINIIRQKLNKKYIKQVFTFNNNDLPLIYLYSNNNYEYVKLLLDHRKYDINDDDFSYIVIMAKIDHKFIDNKLIDYVLNSKKINVHANNVALRVANNNNNFKFINRMMCNKRINKYTEQIILILLSKYIFYGHFNLPFEIIENICTLLCLSIFTTKY
jgi:hypothetical protein